MKAFAALVHREFIEHRGAFLIAPLTLVGLLFGATVIAFAFGRVNAEMSGMLFSAAPMRIYEFGFLAFCMAWCLYLLGTLFFYCADGFSADKRNNAMLFWKSMPVSDFKVLMAKLMATLTVFPGMIFAVALLNGALFFAVAIATSAMSGGDGFAMLGNVVGVFGQVAGSLLVVLALGLLWYLPFMALVGALATVVGRWAIPLSLLLPSIVSTLEWVTLGGWHPLRTHTWDYISYRADFPLTQGYVEQWLTKDAPFSFQAFATNLIARMDWPQMGVGVAFAVLVILIASEYRRRVNAN